MAFDIQLFRDNLKSDVASPSNYEVVIEREPNTLLYKVSNHFPSVMKFRCDSCSLPSKALKYTTQTTYGPPRKVAYSAQYEDTSFSFIATDSMVEKEYFSLWQNSVVDNDIYNGNGNTNSVTYYDDYIGTIVINYYDKSGNLAYRVTFEEAYPIVVNQTELSWISQNDYMRINVILGYKYFTEERFTNNTPMNKMVGVDPVIAKESTKVSTNNVNPVRRTTAPQEKSPSKPTNNHEIVKQVNEIAKNRGILPRGYNPNLPTVPKN